MTLQKPNSGSTSLALLPGLNLSPCLWAFNMATPSPCHSPASKSSMAPSWLEFKILNTLCICVRPTHELQNDQKILGVAFCPFECYSEHNTQMRLSSVGIKTVVVPGAGALVRSVSLGSSKHPSCEVHSWSGALGALPPSLSR